MSPPPTAVSPVSCFPHPSPAIPATSWEGCKIITDTDTHRPVPPPALLSPAFRGLGHSISHLTSLQGWKLGIPASGEADINWVYPKQLIPELNNTLGVEDHLAGLWSQLRDEPKPTELPHLRPLTKVRTEPLGGLCVWGICLGGVNFPDGICQGGLH